MNTIKWDGKPITKPGIYSGISLEDYHHKTDLFDGPSVSKSALKSIFPAHGGSPKAFWGRWAHNPNHVEVKKSEFLDFGKAVHCLLLGDEAFDDKFVVRPEKAPDGRAWNGNNLSCKEWIEDQGKNGKTIITAEQIERIRLIAADTAEYPLVKLGLLNGDVEQTIAYKDAETGLWVRTRPDVKPLDAIFSDLKTASRFDENFLERQLFDHFYYGQAAMTRMACQELGIPFETFVLLFVLNDDVPDTTHVEIEPLDIDRGERAIRWALRTIRRCLDSGEWPGARPFNGGEYHLRMKSWSAARMDSFLDMEDAA